MNVTEAIELVISFTKRADKRTEILANINKAIAYWTLKADFARDLVEDTWNMDANSYSQSLDLSVLATRFRKIKYLRPTTRNYFVTSIDPTQMLGPNRSVQLNRFYITGQSLIMTLGQLDSTIEVGYYQYAPTLSESGVTTHWMLDMIPLCVVERATSQIFKSIGDETSAKYYNDSSLEFFLAARRDFADNVADTAS